MTAIYAPGPWSVKVTSFGITTIQAIDHGVYFKLCKIDANKLSPEGVAGTARVMAAAPELLAALKYAVNSFRPTQMAGTEWIYPDWYEPAKAAIAKAEGTQ